MASHSSIWESDLQLFEMLPSVAVVIALAFMVNLLVLCTSVWHAQLSMDSNTGVQRNHVHPTPRIGGISVFLGALAGYVCIPAQSQNLLGPLLLASMPAFVFGLTEDLTKIVSVRTRLLATMACGVIGYFLTGFSLTDVNVPGVDYLLGFGVVSVMFTAFAVAGVANAINIIDGMNGLASGVVLIILGSFALMSHSLGDVALMQTCIVLGAAVIGFMLLNWPFGKIFLGDGGAYFLGFSVAWTAVLLLWRHPQVSAWAPLLICGFPVLEVLFSIKRRWGRGQSVGAPDRLHLHCLLKRRLVRRLLPGSTILTRNSITGTIMWLVGMLPASIALHYQTDTLTLSLGLGLCALLYSAVHARLTQFHWCLVPFVDGASAKVPS